MEIFQSFPYSEAKNDVYQRKIHEEASVQPQTSITPIASAQMPDRHHWRRASVRELDERLPGEMSLSDLAECCARETDKYRRKEICNDQYCLEIFRRAVLQQDHHAWNVLRQQLSENLRLWIARHPQREVALRYQSEQNYMDDAFTRFWQAIGNQTQIFSTLAGALKYLHLCLNCAIMDTLRAYSRPREEPLPSTGHSQEPKEEDLYLEDELWEVIKGLLPDEKEQRVAYLHFHCNLKPREIVRYCPDEFSNEAEVYRLRRKILDRLLRNADKIRWKLGGD